MRNFLKNEDGMGSIEIIIIIAVLVFVAIFLFKPFAPKLIEWIVGLFK